jgi:hypothetical protein
VTEPRSTGDDEPVDAEIVEVPALDDFTDEELARIGLSRSDLEAIYGYIDDSPEVSGPDDASGALKAVEKDRENPVAKADDMDDLERIHRQSKIESDRQDTGLRKLLAIWSIGAASVMLLLGTAVFFTYMVSEWKDIPVEAILGWLSASVLEVLGIVYVVANYLFPKDKGNDE